MLPDLSPAHILIVVVVALIVVGPKDLPMLLRKIGQFVGKMRGMANEFRASFDEMARQSELDELRKEVEAMRAASQQAVPSMQDIGLDAGLNHTEAEGAYMAQWEASHATPTDYEAPAVMPDTSVAEIKAAKKASKPKAASAAADAPAKAKVTKAAVKKTPVEAPAKPRKAPAKKTKTAPEADA